MPVAIPTLEQVIERRECLDALPVQVLRMLRARALAAAHMVEIAELGRIEPTAAGPDEVLPLAEAARRLGLAALTLQHRAHRAPYAALRVDNGTRRLVFSGRRIAEFLGARRPGSDRSALAQAVGGKASRLARPPIPPRTG